MADQLTAKQRLFVVHYLDTLNATEAARRAGYAGKPNTLSVIGHENLRKPNVAAEILKGYEGLAMPRDEILARLTLMARAELPTKTTFGSKGANDDYDAKGATETLAKHYGLLIERTEHTGTIEHQHTLSDSEVVREFAAILTEAEAGSIAGTGNGNPVSVDSKGKK